VHGLRRRRPDRGAAGPDPRRAPSPARPGPGVLMRRAAVAVARLVRALIRRAGRGGTTAPGRVLLRLDPGAISHLGERLEAGAALVSATNGKTTTASMLAAALECADDPLVADLGRDRRRVTYFGVEDDSLALPELQHAADSKHCRNCGHAYVYDAIYMGHLGRYRCPNCGRERPAPAVAAERVTLRGMAGSEVALRTPAGETTVRLPLPGLYNVYNALAATAAAL